MYPQHFPLKTRELAFTSTRIHFPTFVSSFYLFIDLSNIILLKTAQTTTNPQTGAHREVKTPDNWDIYVIWMGIHRATLESK